MTLARPCASMPHAGVLLVVGLTSLDKATQSAASLGGFSKGPCVFYFAVLGRLFLSGGTLSQSWGSPDSDGSRRAGVFRSAAHAARRRQDHSGLPNDHHRGSGRLQDAACRRLRRAFAFASRAGARQPACRSWLALLAISARPAQSIARAAAATSASAAAAPPRSCEHKSSHWHFRPGS